MVELLLVECVVVELLLVECVVMELLFVELCRGGATTCGVVSWWSYYLWSVSW